MQGSQHYNSYASLKGESVWFKTKLISQFLTLSFLLTQPFFLPYLHAAPAGGEVVGGTGSISQSDLTTTINQSSQNLAIDWQSFDLNTNEIVNFVQPNSSSIALNRILGNNGSTIQGQINANGQVILVNPNGIFFTSTATINVGGIIASSLDMTPSDFMNGNYIFNEVLGADGAVINSGLITASLGGNVALIGKQVKNEGLITAKLGSVVLAAGKQSVLTFDNQGLIGVKVTKEVLQEELGLEDALINSGDINAAGGRVLLTASVSQDIFTQAVNNGLLDQATSVVVNADGTFTLGGGADVLNTGSIDVSSETNSQNTARIILLGENITSSGSIKADVQNGIAGEIEIHAKNKTLLTENSITRAKALSSGQGGLIKILGNKVGLFDSALVDTSGANGGGEVLIGGDQKGRNSLMRNSQFIYLGEQSQVKADANDNGDGGRVIGFAENSAKIHAQLFARGGVNGGNGGFIETSGLLGFQITSVPDASAFVGANGSWLIDPYSITITGNTQDVDDDNGNFGFFDAIASGAEIDVDNIISGLKKGDVIIRTTRTDGDPDVGTEAGNITFAADLDFDGIGNSSKLTLDADNNIDTKTRDIWDTATGSGTDKLNIVFNADADNSGSGNVILDDSRIYTNGGTFTATGQNFTSSRGGGGGATHYLDTRDKTNNTKGGVVNIYMLGDVDIGAEIFTGGGTVNIGDMSVSGSEIRPTSFINRNDGIIDTTGEDNIDGGDIIINVDNTTVANGKITINADLISDGGKAVKGTIGAVGRDAGAITLNATGDITVNSKIDSNGTKGNRAGGISEITGWDGGNGNSVTITSSNGNISLTQEISTKGGDGDGDSDLGANADPASGGTGGKIEIEATLGSITVDKLTSTGGKGSGGDAYPGSSPATFANGGDAGEIKLTALTAGKTITLNNDIDAAGGILDFGSGTIYGNDGYGADITFFGDVIIGANIGIDSSGYTVFPTPITPTGHVWFKNTVTGDRNKNLTISANNILFDADVGSAGLHLGDVELDAVGIIDADVFSLYVDTLNVTNSNKFTSGNIDAIGIAGLDVAVDGNSRTITINSDTTIDTGDLIANAVEETVDSVGRDGGIVQLTATGKITTGLINSSGSNAFAITSSIFKDNGGVGGSVQLNGEEIEVGEINSSGGNAVGDNKKGGNAGTISIDATSGSNNVANITLNGDVNSNGGLGSGGGANGSSEIADLSTNGTGVGTIKINHPSAYTSFVNVTGNTSDDTIIGSARTNIWNINGTDDGDLNTQITFNNIENLTGNNVQDDFKFISGGTLSGNIDGGANTSATVFNSITGDSGNNIWTIDTNDDSGTVTNLGGRFSSVGSLIGNTGRDDFTINGDVGLSGSIDGVGGSAGGTTLLDDLKNSLTINSASDNTWTISSADGGTMTTGVSGTFSNIQKVKGGTGDDTFNVGGSGSLDLIEGGADNSTSTLGDIVNFTAGTPSNGADIALGTTLTVSQTDVNIDSVEQINADSSATKNLITGKDQLNTWNISKADGGDVESTVNFSNFTHLIGGSQDDRFVVGLNGSLSGEIDGKGQNTVTGDQLDLSARLNVQLTIDGAAGNSISYGGAVSPISYLDIETIVGNNTTSTSTVVGENIDSTWLINGIDTGTVVRTAGGTTTRFSGFGILNGGSSNDKFTITSTGAISEIINGGGDNTGDTLTITTPAAMVNLALGTAVNLTATNITNIENITGDNANVTLIGENLGTTTTTWNITGTNDGNVNYSGGTVNFSNVNNLTGGSGNDLFDFAPGTTGTSLTHYISGLIDGGAHLSNGSDIINMAKLTGAFTVTLDTDIIRIESITGNDAGSTNDPDTTLAGAPDVVNTLLLTTWNVTGINDGDVTYTDADNDVVTVTFTDFNSLQGQDHTNDIFNITSTGDVRGDISGGGGSGIDSVDYSSSNITNVNVGSSTGIGGIEQVIGDSDITLTGVQQAGISNAWVIDDDTFNISKDGANDGFVTYNLGAGDETLSFVNFGSLQAGIAGDSFTIQSNGSFTGTITGGIGDDSFTINNGGSFTGTVVSGGGTNIYDINAGTLFDGTITGSTTSETVNLTLSGTQSGGLIFNGNATATNTLNIDGDSDNGGNGTDYSGVYTSDIDGLHSDKFVYTNAVNTNEYTIQYLNADTVQDDLFANKLTVNGTQYNDVITLDSTSFQVSHSAFFFVPANQATKVDYSNKNDLTVDTLTNITLNGDEIKLIAPLDFGTTGTIELKADRLTLPNTVTYPGVQIRAGSLKLDTINIVAPAVINQSNVIQTDITSLSIANSGAVNINELDAIDIEALSTNGSVTVTNITGDITSSTALVSSGALNLNAMNGNINLSGANELIGALTLTTTTTNNDITLFNTTATKLDNVTTRDLSITATGTTADIHQTTNSTVISTGLASLESTGDVTLANTTNEFDIVEGLSLSNFDIRDVDSISLNNIKAVEVKIVSGGDILDSNANNIGDNVEANKLTLRAETGIGYNSTTLIDNALETNVSEIDAITTSGEININNEGNVKLTNLISNGGDITFNNNFGNVELDTIDAGYDTGTFNLTVVGGSVTGFIGNPAKNYIADPDITAFIADITVASGTFGSIGRPIGVRIKNRFSLFSLQSAVDYSRSPPSLDIDDRSTAKISITDAFSNLAGQQLIEIESIGDVDPAIFTDVRNYNHSDLALMMPSDQRYDVSDEEEDEEAKQKREKLINSTP